MDISEFSRLHTTSNYSRHPWEIARGKVLLRLLSEKVPLPQPSLVDIGSGDAYIINLVCKKKIADAYYAIDINYTPDIIEALQKNNSHSPIQYFASTGDLQNSNPPSGQILYLCMDVLEHLENEKEVLDLIAKAPLKKGSAFYFFSVPAFQSVFSNHDVLLGHYRRYTVTQFKDLLTRQGLTVIDSGYFFFSLLVARWFEKKLIRKKEYSIDNWEGSKFKTKLLTSILSLDFSITRILNKAGIRLPGLSCYCICQA
jgi:2-polyprenyl-3-methyl-5-hydroxy-6-metoxy-1,4-benzoquinol methylase